MFQSVYDVESQIESTHWWFMGRRKLIAKLILKLGIPFESPVLDIGTSTGTNLRLFSKLGYTHVSGVDMSEDAIRYCSQKSLGKVIKGDICNLPFEDNRFHLILATDIIEHVEDDMKALFEIKRVLSDSGYVIITVPAFRFLWGRQDVVSQHKRRYSRTEFYSKIKNAGLYHTECFYFNYLLLPLIFSMRKLMSLLHIEVKSENEINTPALNLFFNQIFLLDVKCAQKIKPPFGASLLAVVRK